MNLPIPFLAADATQPTQGSATRALAMLVCGLFALGFQIWVLISRGKGWGPISTRMCGITLIVVAALFIVTAPIARENATSVIGLLGTIAGYVLGKSDKMD